MGREIEIHQISSRISLYFSQHNFEEKNIWIDLANGPACRARVQACKSQQRGRGGALWSVKVNRGVTENSLTMMALHIL